MTERTRYSPEVHERAIRLVREQRAAHGSEWAAVTSICQQGRVFGADVVAADRAPDSPFTPGIVLTSRW